MMVTAGNNFRLQATSGSLEPEISNRFVVLPGPADMVSFTTDPSENVVAGLFDC